MMNFITGLTTRAEIYDSIIPSDILIINYGQSNTIGFSSPDLPTSEYLTPPNAKIIGGYDGGVLQASFEPMEYGVNNYGDSFGAELSTAKHLNGGYFCKIGKSGSSVWGLTKTANLAYPQLLTLINRAVLQKNFKKIVLDYNQWEGDSATSTDDYVSRFKSIITDLEADANIEIDIILAAKARAEGGFTFDNIIQAQNEISTYYGAKYKGMNYDDIPMKDNWHYTGAGYTVIGNRLADTIKLEFGIS